MKTKQYNIIAIIVNWNGKDDTVRCLESLQKISLFGNTLSIIVVDNGSTNDSVSVIKKTFPGIFVIETGKNLGFTGGNNIGIQKAMEIGADLIWFLNNDTLVDRQVLSFASVFDDSSVGACGSKIYFAAGHEFHHDRYKESERGRVFWYAGGIVDWNNLYASHRGVDEVDHGQYDKSIETPFITGCSLVVRREVVERVGMLDDKYFLYLEDLDWNIRIQKAGYKTIYFPKSIVWHVNAGSSGRPGNPMHEYYFTRNRLFLGMRYASLRTKFALIREGFRFFIGKSAIRRKAVLDWLFGRLGFQYEPKKYN
ncbi:MAG: Glycosyl transferase family 2 [Microgenomates group bacterium GW2011_GWB1_40_9]|nr:MAG: Glycosyl transferase family 2 [Microgenomates group bacterium GW2011_GWC1_39_12]KKR79747.1 MAG: Glycosyl transferase family 2 [Microgenomates group bacterium GW2011_GWB1_40_9]